MHRAKSDGPTLEFSVLGPLSATFDGIALKLGGGKQQMVLALLLLEANRVVATDRLVEWVWGADAGERTPGTVQVYVSNLRRVLASAANRLGRDVIVTTRPGYQLQADVDQLDLLRLDALRRAGEDALDAGQHDTSAGAFRSALQLYRGEPLAGLPLQPCADEIRGRLEIARTSLLERVGETALAVGRHREVLAELITWSQAYPLNERLRGLQMLALYRCGRQAEALSAYRLGREEMIGELGIDPSRALQELEQRILNQDAALEWQPGLLSRGGGEVGSTLLRSSVVVASACLHFDGKTVALTQRVTTIGRLPDRDVVLGDSGVSRRHAEIRRSRDVYLLVDHGSANGTSVNGIPITTQQLKDGDLIKVGAIVLRFRAP